MEKKMMFGAAALAILAIAAISVVGTYAYPGTITASAAASGDCSGDMLHTRLRTQDRDCDGLCNGTMVQNRAQVQNCQDDPAGCSSTQCRLMLQGGGCQGFGGENALLAQNQHMAQACRGGP